MLNFFRVLELGQIQTRTFYNYFHKLTKELLACNSIPFCRTNFPPRVLIPQSFSLISSRLPLRLLPGTKNLIILSLHLFFILFKIFKTTKASTDKSNPFYPTIFTLAYPLTKETTSFYPPLLLLLFQNSLNLTYILLSTTGFMKVRKSEHSGRIIFCMENSQILD